jgi:hypothetical protein
MRTSTKKLWHSKLWYSAQKTRRAIEALRLQKELREGVLLEKVLRRK